MKRIGNLTTICALSMACGSSPAAPTPPPPTNIAQTAHQAVRCGRVRFRSRRLAAKDQHFSGAGDLEACN